MFKFPPMLVAVLLLSSAIFAQGSLIEVAEAEPAKPSTIYGFVHIENIIKTIYPSKDAHICPDIAKGEADFLSVAYFSSSGVRCNTLIYFDLSSIPDNAVIQSAYLYLYKKKHYVIESGKTYNNLYIYRVTKYWSESEVTWTHRTSTRAWTNPGGDYATTPQFHFRSYTSETAGKEYKIDITDLVKKWLDGTYPNYGIIIVAEASWTGGIQFYSREYSDAAYRPKLGITYSLPSINIQVTPSSIEVAQGEQAVYQVSVSATGYDGSVQLKLKSDPPPGAAYSFNPSTGTPPFNSILTIATTSNTPPGTYNLKIKGEGAGLSSEKTVKLVVKQAVKPDFSLDVSPPSFSVKRGGAATYTIDLTPISGFSDTVILSISGLPSGATYEFDPPSGTPPFTSTLSIQTTETTPQGTYTLIITASGGGKTHSESVDLVVKAMPDFSIEVSPPSITIRQGESPEYVIAVLPVEGFGGEVSLSVSGLPSEATVSLNPPSGIPPFKSVMKIQTSEDTPAGSYTIIVTGTGGGKTHSASAKLVVKVLPSFSITLSDEEKSIIQGESVDLTVSIGSSGGFSDIVRLAMRGLREGLTANFNPESGNAPYKSTLTIAASEDTPPGTYELMVVAEGGGVVKTKNFRLNVEKAVKPFDFELTVSPSSIRIKPGQSATLVIIVDLKSGKAEPVSLIAAGLPSDFSYSFNPPSVTPTGSSTLQLTAGNTAGSYTLVVQASGGGVVKTASVDVEVVEEKRCLIATAAFGSEIAPQVQALREFRDGFVVKTFAGESFMKAFNAFYYSWSPYVAQAEYENPILRNIVKLSIYPLIYSLEFSRVVAQPFSMAPELAVLISGVVASFLIGLIYISPISVAAALLWRLKFGRFPSLKSRSIILALLLSLTWFMVAEVISSTTLMMVASALTVISCMAMGAISTPIILELFLDRKEALSR